MIWSREGWAADIGRYTTPSSRNATPLRDLAPARYRIVAGDSNAECGPLGDTVLDLTGGSKNQPLVVSAGGDGSVQVVAEPDQWQTVALLPADGSRLLEAVFKDHNGQFTYKGLRPGRYQITSSLDSQDVMVKSGDTTNVKLAKEVRQR